MHNYGEAFVDKQLPAKIAYAKSKGIPEVGVITNGSLLGPDVARAVIEAGLDAINISLDAAGKDDVRVDAPRPEVRQGHRQRRGPRPHPARARAQAAEAHPVVRPAGQLGRGTGVHRSLVRGGGQDPHHRAAQLGRHAEAARRRQLPLLPPVADLHGAVGRPCQPLLRRPRRPCRARRPEQRRPSRTSGTATPTAASVGSIWRAAARTSAATATCRRRTRRSG